MTLAKVASLIKRMKKLLEEFEMVNDVDEKRQANMNGRKYSEYAKARRAENQLRECIKGLEEVAAKKGMNRRKKVKK